MVKKIITMLLIFILCLSFSGCGIVYIKQSGQGGYEEELFEKEIYLLEDGQYIPYILVSNDYYGNKLLLRRDVMDKDMFIDEYSAEYENSFIDNYLCSAFLDLFEDNVQQKMAEVPVEVTSIESLYTAGKQTYTINRKAFLLSFSEVDCGEHGMAATEGEPLDFFTTEENKIAFKNGGPYSWWLRTPYTGYESVSWGISDGGARVELSSSSENGIRPAICFSQAVEFVPSNDVFDGESVYVIE